MNATDSPLATPVAETAGAAIPDTAPGADSGASEDFSGAASAQPGKSGGRRRGGRGGRRGAAAPASDAPAGKPAAGERHHRQVHPLLEQLASLYPRLFGGDFLPLKRGIFQDLREAHPELLAPDALKEALGQHTRSTRYLQTIAAARPRHDLAGQSVEALAPEHVYQALIELWRRRSHRTPESGQAALRDEWRKRIVRAFESSGLARDEYAEKVRTRDEIAGALLDEALSEASAQAAKDEALLRAFEAGQAELPAFADMYGLDPRQTARVLEAAQRRRGAAPAVAPAPAA
ncbi:ProQ/FINO family protein [Xylophilus rhododendri]|uniref:ProQ/FINO family protein n=1 Tax=Xylophilus rhododendri TaxID=2697032 RepID=UPI001E480E80|nr:ProQ/FINO family protein [Xylophilus rhododendri]